MDYGIYHPSLFSAYQSQLPRTVLDAVNTLIVRYGCQKPPQKCCFSRAGCPRHGGLAGAGRACHTDGDAVAQAGGQEIQHFLRGSPAIYKILFFHILRVYDTD